MKTKQKEEARDKQACPDNKKTWLPSLAPPSVVQAPDKSWA